MTKRKIKMTQMGKMINKKKKKTQMEMETKEEEEQGIYLELTNRRRKKNTDG